MDSTPRSVRRLALTATGALSGLALAVTSAPALAAGSIPEVDEIRSSRNVSLLSNTPKSDALPGFNSDLAFSDDLAFQGNYDGFRIWDIDDPEEPEIVSEVLLPRLAERHLGHRGPAVPVHRLSPQRRLLHQRPSRRRRREQRTTGRASRSSTSATRTNPEYVKAIETDCGSHTHTLVPGERRRHVYIYVSSYDLSATSPTAGRRTTRSRSSRSPSTTRRTRRWSPTPVLFPDGGNAGDPLDTPFPSAPARPPAATTSPCFPAKDLAAGACMGDGVLLDISDPRAARVIDRVQDDENFAFWHSATFNNAGTKVVFTDELGGGGARHLQRGDRPTRAAPTASTTSSAAATSRKLVFRSYYKIPREQRRHRELRRPQRLAGPGARAGTSWCSPGTRAASRSSTSPTRASPKEIGCFERGPLSDTELVVGGSWSAYWYNGNVYRSDIVKGFDVLELRGKRFERAERVEFDELNVQSQPVFSQRHGRGHR